MPASAPSTSAPAPRRGKLRIGYCGPIAEPGKPARGGFAAANRRLIDDLERRGVNVVEFPYPVALGSNAAKTWTYLRRFAGIAVALVRSRRQFDIFHYTPLYRRFLFAEGCLCLLVSLLGKRMIFDIRGGGFIDHYRKRSGLYRAVADALIARAAVVAIEGREYEAFVTARRTKPVVYLPNYVTTGTAARETPRATSPLRLVFVGRINAEKGVDKIVHSLEALRAMDVGATLEIIGPEEEGSVDFKNALVRRAEPLSVTWSGALPGEEIRKRLSSAHFFVFPTHREGHSNALTEAMAEGVVPICSDAGFNPSVVGESGAVLPVSATPAEYARTIAETGAGAKWRTLSQRARTRVAERFTGEAVLPALIEAYHAASSPSTVSERSAACTIPS